MKKPYPALCKDCKYSKPEEHQAWNLRCHNPIINAKDSWALSSIDAGGSNCSAERERKWPAPCGRRGALWEEK